jgi:hypothetical protein
MEKSTKTFRSQLEFTALTGSAPRDSAGNPTAVDWSALTDNEKSAAWAKIRKYYAPRIGKGVTIQSLATNQSWFASRAGDYVDDFICLSWEQLQGRRGFGKRKLDLLLQICFGAMCRDSQWMSEEAAAPSWSPAFTLCVNARPKVATFNIAAALHGRSLRHFH